MKVEVSLYGAFRACQPEPQVILELPDGARVSDLRLALEAHGNVHWPDFRPALLRSSAFASQVEVLREHEALPVDGRVAVLPPVSGG